MEILVRGLLFSDIPMWSNLLRQFTLTFGKIVAMAKSLNKTIKPAPAKGIASVKGSKDKDAVTHPKKNQSHKKSVQTTFSLPAFLNGHQNGAHRSIRTRSHAEIYYEKLLMTEA